jgi:hypothetical protein
VKETEIRAGELVEPGEYAPVLFNLADKALDEVPFTVEVFVIIALGNSPGTRRDDGICSVLINKLDEFITVISFVSNDVLRGVTRYQCLSLSDVMSMTSAQPETQWVAKSINTHMNFCTESPSRAS